MSLFINTIDNATVFSTTPTALDSPINNADTTLAVTTNYLYNVGIPLSISQQIRSTIIFTANILCNLITGESSVLSFSGNVALGKSGGITNFYGTNTFVANYPYWVSSGGLSRQDRKIFAGVFTTTNNALIAFPTANFFVSNGLCINTGTSDKSFGNNSTVTNQSRVFMTPTVGGGTVHSIYIGP